jgi:hypothetical protein
MFGIIEEIHFFSAKNSKNFRTTYDRHNFIISVESLFSMSKNVRTFETISDDSSSNDHLTKRIKDETSDIGSDTADENRLQKMSQAIKTIIEVSSY